MEKLLSIIIPSYNAEKTLGTTLDSLCRPEFIDELDVIVVNDGSTDGTAAVAKEYAARFPESVRLITKENGGHGSGINTGVKEAAGEYLRVIDADDWASKDGLDALLKFLREHRKEKAVDLVSTQFLWAFDPGTGEDVESFPVRAQFKEPFEGVEYGKVYDFPGICEKLYLKFHNLTYRTDLLREHGITFDEHCYYEDAQVALYPCLVAKTIAFLRQPLYMYRIGRKGQSMDPEKMVRNEANYRRVLESLLQKYEEFRESQSTEELRKSREIRANEEFKVDEKSRGNETLEAGENESKLSVRRYMEHFIARFYAGYIKVLLLMPKGKESLTRLVETEQMLKEKYPDIYAANINRAVKLLRSSNYRLYDLAAFLIKFRKTV